MSLFSNTEIIVMASIIGVILLIIIVLTILDFIDAYKERKQKDNMNNINSDNIKEDSIKENIVEQTVLKENEESPKIETEEIEVLDFDDDKEECELITPLAKEENTEYILAEDEVKYDTIMPIKIDNCPEVLKKEKERLIEELTQKDNFEDTITNFEIEQEQSAIISYDELVKVSDKIYKNNIVSQYDDGNEPITIDEVIKRFSNDEMTFENTANYEKLNKSIDNGEKNLVESYKNE